MEIVCDGQKHNPPIAACGRIFQDVYAFAGHIGGSSHGGRRESGIQKTGVVSQGTPPSKEPAANSATSISSTRLEMVALVLKNHPELLELMANTLWHKAKIYLDDAQILRSFIDNKSKPRVLAPLNKSILPVKKQRKKYPEHIRKDLWVRKVDEKKVPTENLLTAREILKNGGTYLEIAKRFNMSKSNARSALNYHKEVGL